MNSRKLQWSDIIENEEEVKPIKPIKPIYPAKQGVKFNEVIKEIKSDKVFKPIKPTNEGEVIKPQYSSQDNITCRSPTNRNSIKYCDCDVCQIRKLSNDLYDITSGEKTEKFFFEETLKCFNESKFVKTKIMRKVENNKYKDIQVLLNRRNVKAILGENIDLTKRNIELTDQINIYEKHLSELEERLIGFENLVKLSKGDKPT